MLQRHLGLLLSGISLLVLVLIISAALQMESQRQHACELVCGDEEQCGMASCPYLEQRQLPWFLWASAILIAGLGSIGAYLAFQKDVIEHRTYDLSSLSAEEKTAFRKIRETGGIFQNQLARELGISHVKMTRLLDKLEQHDLIERRRRGMTNWVVLK